MATRPTLNLGANLVAPSALDYLSLLAGTSAQQGDRAGVRVENLEALAASAEASPFTFSPALLGNSLAATAGLDLALALQSGYSLPLLMSGVAGGVAAPLPLGQALALPSVPSSELPKLLSLDLTAADRAMAGANAAAAKDAAAAAAAHATGQLPGLAQQANNKGAADRLPLRQDSGGARKGKGKGEQPQPSTDSDGSNLTADEGQEDDEMDGSGAKKAKPTRAKAPPNSKEAQLKAQQRALKKRDLNREAQRRFRDRQKAALSILEETNNKQWKEINQLRMTQKLLEEQYKILLEQYKALQLRFVALQMKNNANAS